LGFLKETDPRLEHVPGKNEQGRSGDGCNNIEPPS
jgi:hypothetical protein